MQMTYEAIAQRIDHALLLPNLTDAAIQDGCALAAHYRVKSVCIKPYAIARAVELLRGSDVAVGTVVGFPHGGQTIACKVAETVEALKLGASEIDMVVNISEVLSDHWEPVAAEITQITRAVRDHDAIIKVIFETCYLTDASKIRLCEVCSEIGVDFVKTSTGFGTGGATAADVQLMRRHSSEHVQVKASGAIKDLETAITMIDLGAERLGLSRTAEILDAWNQRLGRPVDPVSRGTMESGPAADPRY